MQEQRKGQGTARERHVQSMCKTLTMARQGQSKAKRKGRAGQEQSKGKGEDKGNASVR